MRISVADIYTIPRITAANIHFSYEITKKKLHFSNKGNKKAATAKCLLLKIGVFPISFMGCIYG